MFSVREYGCIKLLRVAFQHREDNRLQCLATVATEKAKESDRFGKLFHLLNHSTNQAVVESAGCLNFHRFMQKCFTKR